MDLLAWILGLDAAVSELEGEEEKLRKLTVEEANDLFMLAVYEHTGDKRRA